MVCLWWLLLWSTELKRQIAVWSLPWSVARSGRPMSCPVIQHERLFNYNTGQRLKKYNTADQLFERFLPSVSICHIVFVTKRPWQSAEDGPKCPKSPVYGQRKPQWCSPEWHFTHRDERTGSCRQILCHYHCQCSIAGTTEHRGLSGGRQAKVGEGNSKSLGN